MFKETYGFGQPLFPQLLIGLFSRRTNITIIILIMFEVLVSFPFENEIKARKCFFENREFVEAEEADKVI